MRGQSHSAKARPNIRTYVPTQGTEAIEMMMTIYKLISSHMLDRKIIICTVAPQSMKVNVRPPKKVKSSEKIEAVCSFPRPMCLTRNFEIFIIANVIVTGAHCDFLSTSYS